MYERVLELLRDLVMDHVILESARRPGIQTHRQNPMLVFGVLFRASLDLFGWVFLFVRFNFLLDRLDKIDV